MACLFLISFCELDYTLSLTEFPHFENDNMKYLLNDCNMYELFGINVCVKCCSQKECKGFLKNEKLSGRSQHG